MGAMSDIWRGRSTVSANRTCASDRCPSGTRESTGNSPSIIEEGDFRINIDSRTAAVKGRELRLSNAEFDVLVFLTSHRRHLVTSQTKLATRGESGGVRQTEFLPALLSLRKKLQEQAPGIPYINTEAWLLFDFHPGALRTQHREL